MPQLAARAVTRKTVATERVCVGVGGDGASSRLYVAAQPARQHPHRTQPSMAVLHPVDARHRALGGAMVPTILSERSSKFGIFLTQAPTPYMQPGAPHSSFGTY